MILRYFFYLLDTVFKVCLEIITFLCWGFYQLAWPDEMCLKSTTLHISLFLFISDRGEIFLFHPIECTGAGYCGRASSWPSLGWAEQVKQEFILSSSFFIFPPTTSAWPHSITTIAELFTCISRARWFNLKTWIHFHCFVHSGRSAMTAEGEAQVNKCWARWIIVSDWGSMGAADEARERSRVLFAPIHRILALQITESQLDWEESENFRHTHVFLTQNTKIYNK